jgi:shikimate dehydrogenase
MGGTAVRDIRGDTKIVAVFGHPVAHSVSPAMHNAAFEALGMNWCYVAFDVAPEAVGSAVEAIRALGMVGANVTVPHKEAVLPYLDEVDATAQMVGAVNTIRNDGGRLSGYNTDVAGFLRALERHEVLPSGMRALVLGAGGAARGVCCALLQAGVASLTILNRTEERGQSLASGLRAQKPQAVIEAGPLQGERLTRAVAQADLIVNTTSYGMHPQYDVPSIIPEGMLQIRHAVCDLVYNPRETSLLAAARAVGAKAVPGLPMLVYQGAIAFESWTGREAPVDVMMEAAEEAMGQQGRS